MYFSALALSIALLNHPQQSAPAPVPAGVAAAAAYSEAHEGRALLVMKDGAVVFERYANGWSADKPHPLASGTKSFTGVLAMCAIEDGLIASLDERISDTIIEWRDDAKKSQITVRHLLTLSSGLEPNHKSLGRQGAGIKGLSKNPLPPRIQRAADNYVAPDRFKAAVTIPSEGAPGTRFHYGAAHYYAFGELLTRKLKASDRAEKTYWDYLRNRVLVPCGIDVGVERFAPDVARQPDLPGGGHLTARMVKFGEMVRLGGVVKGADGSTTRIVATEQLAHCFEPSATNPSYGLTWWLGQGKPGSVGLVNIALDLEFSESAAQPASRPSKDSAPTRVWIAAGAGKERMYVLPDHGIVIVRFAAIGPDAKGFNDEEFLKRFLGVATP